MYDEHALMYIALNDDFEIVGMMRILRDWMYDKLPYLDHPSMKGKSHDIHKSGEFSRLILHSRENKNLILQGLFRLALQKSVTADLENWIIIAEPSLIRFLERFYIYFSPIANPAKYFGDFTLPAVLNVQRQIKTFDRYTSFYREDPSIISLESSAIMV